MKPRYPLLAAIGAALLVSIAPAIAQSSELVELQTLVATSGGPTQFTFADHGTGATGYVAEYSPAVGATASWQTVGTAVFTDLGGGRKQVSLPSSAPGFFRVRCIGGTANPIVVNFPNATLDLSEGDSGNATVNFSRPYYGTIRYTIGGTAGAVDYQGLTGEVTVNGTTSVVIPVSLTDNNTIGQLKTLTLTLVSGGGVQPGGGATTTINIDENDAAWQGSLVASDATLGFILKIQKSGGSYTASLAGDGTGFFPTNEVPVAITFTADVFAATAVNITLPANSTLLNQPMDLSLQLEAANGVTNQIVSATEVDGVGTMICAVPAKPYLSTTNSGTFHLLKPPVQPSTSQVGLVRAP